MSLPEPSRRSAAAHGVRAALGAVALVALLGTIMGCAAPTEPTVPSASPAGAIGVPATSSPTSSGPANSGQATSQTPAPIVVDPTLLALLPVEVDGVTLKPAPEAAAAMTADAYLGMSASAIAVGIAATGSASGDDFASVNVVRLRPGVYSDAFFEAWQQAYDAAACAPAGGVTGHRQQVIGTHMVEVTLCAGGARTLHAHLSGDILISITTVGARGFGGLVLAGLRE